MERGYRRARERITFEPAFAKVNPAEIDLDEGNRFPQV